MAFTASAQVATGCAMMVAAAGRPSQMLAPSLFSPAKTPADAAPHSAVRPRRLLNPWMLMPQDLLALVLGALFQLTKLAPSVSAVSREWNALTQQVLLARRGSGHPWWSGRRKPLLAMVDDTWA